MKQSKIIILFLFISQLVFAQEEKKPVALVFNNGLGSAGITFNYLENTDPNAQMLELNSGTTSPFVANPGLRFYNKRGYHEIGFNNILLGGRGEGIYDNSQNIVNYQALNLFASSLYFNKSIRVKTIMGGDLFAGLEPTFNYSTVSSGFQRDFKYVGRNLGGDLKLLLRWDHFFKENAFVSLVGGLSPFYLNYQLVEHKLTDAETSIYLNEANFNWRLSQVVQLTFGIIL
jgi:hypothetical protein